MRGIRSQRRDAIDVLVPLRRRAPDLLPPELPAVFVHRTSYLPKQDRQRGRPDRTTIPRSLVDAASWAITADEARSVIAAGCQQKLVLPEEVLEVVARMPTVRRRALIQRAARTDRILRFSGFQVRRRPADVAEQIRRGLVAAGWRP